MNQGWTSQYSQGQLVEPHVIGGRTTLAPNHTPSFDNAIYM
jgi:hypothetical protein